MTVGSAAAVKHARHAKEPALVAAGRAAAAAAALLRHFAAVAGGRESLQRYQVERGEGKKEESKCPVFGGRGLLRGMPSSGSFLHLLKY